MYDFRSTELAVVVIGRNEGERLRTCLFALQTSSMAELIVYVDSGSTDDSVAMATAMGCLVHSLDMSMPFTAARARNEGAYVVRSRMQNVRFLQFVDGDCEVLANWLPEATEFLHSHGDVAAVCGRRRERYPDQSVFNRLCDIEWDTPLGEARSCGGDVLMRADAFFAAGGYKPSLIAGEEPELCVRLRSSGWKIWRLGVEMTLHDAAMYRFAQWWHRSKRAGYAFAEGAHLHGAAPERHYVNEMRRAVLWGALLPIALGLGSLWNSIGYGLLFLYPVQVIRIGWKGTTVALGFAWPRAIFLVLAKFPEFIGVLKFWKNQLSGKAGTIIEYK